MSADAREYAYLFVLGGFMYIFCIVMFIYKYWRVHQEIKHGIKSYAVVQHPAKQYNNYWRIRDEAVVSIGYSGRRDSFPRRRGKIALGEFILLTLVESIQFVLLVFSIDAIPWGRAGVILRGIAIDLPPHALNVLFWVILALYPIYIVAASVGATVSFSVVSFISHVYGHGPEFGTFLMEVVFFTQYRQCFRLMGCHYNSENHFVLRYDNSVRCWKGAHIAYFIFSVIYVLAIYPLALHLQTTFKARSGPALAFSPYFSMNLFAIKVILCITIGFVAEVPLAAIIIFMLCFGYLLVLQYIQQPYFHNEGYGIWLNNMRTAVFASALYTSTCGFVLLLLPNWESHVTVMTVIATLGIIPVSLLAVVVNHKPAKAMYNYKKTADYVRVLQNSLYQTLYERPSQEEMTNIAETKEGRKLIAEVCNIPFFIGRLLYNFQASERLLELLNLARKEHPDAQEMRNLLISNTQPKDGGIPTLKNLCCRYIYLNEMNYKSLGPDLQEYIGFLTAYTEESLGVSDIGAAEIEVGVDGAVMV